MTKKLTLALLLLNTSLLYAQTLKTDVLVLGSGASATAAAVQCARSKIKTVLALPDTTLMLNAAAGWNTVKTGRYLPSGIWGEFRKRVQEYYKNTPGHDTAVNAPLNFETFQGASILKKIADTVKNLTLYSSAQFIGIKKDGDRWEVAVKQNDKTITIKARVVVDATETGDIALKTGGQFLPPFDPAKNNDGEWSYRTSIACGENLQSINSNDANTSKNNYPVLPAYCIPMKQVVVRNVDNILVTEKVIGGDRNDKYLPLQLTLGQGVGTVAAFCAFFKTTTQKLNVRIIQGELLDFKGDLLPFTDILPNDPDRRAIQQIAATGLLKGIERPSVTGAGSLFRPDSLVATAEIRPIMTEIYTRFFLWYNREKPGEKFTIGNLVSFISDHTLTEPLFLKSSIQKAWKTQYKFTGDFDMNRQITRREFAILANKYLNPFARTIDLDGRPVN